MKKVLTLMLVLFSALSFTACGETEPQPDFRSILDTETGTIFTLGDSLSVFVEALGEGEKRESPWARFPEYRDLATWELFSFSDLNVGFVNGMAFHVATSSSRFSFAYVDIEMSIDELDEQFLEDSIVTSNPTYIRRFDVYGNTVFDINNTEYDQRAIFIDAPDTVSFINLNWRGEFNRITAQQ